MTNYTPIDLSTVPAPNVVEALSYETILAAMLTDLQTRDTAFTALVESDPAYKILEVAAYRELLIRQRVNDGARAVMLAYATGSDLENLSALFGVTRKILDEGDATALPPIPPTFETDAALRYRTQLALEGLSTAGPIGAYQFHALSVDGVKDAGIQGPPNTDPGEVLVTILSATGSGTAGAPHLPAYHGSPVRTHATARPCPRAKGPRPGVAQGGCGQHGAKGPLQVSRARALRPA